jgi:hypothetical protein
VKVGGKQRTFNSMGDIGAYTAPFLPGRKNVISHADTAVLNQRITAALYS